MKATGDSSDGVRPGASPSAEHLRRLRRRRCLCCLLVLLLLIFLLFIVALVLALTLFKARDPTTHLVSARVQGVSPRVSLPALRIELNVTLDLDLLVHNPNRASFAHAPGAALLYYRGAEVGQAEVAAGKIPSRGDEHVACALTVEADRLAAMVGSLIGDVVGGEVAFDTSTRIPGRVAFLGFIKHHAVSTSECHLVVGFPELRVKRQECTHKTKL